MKSLEMALIIKKSSKEIALMNKYFYSSKLTFTAI